MKVHHGRARNAASVHQQDTFTGDSWADPVITDAQGATAHQVFFAPRARTFWHAHAKGQILCVTSGAGYVASRDGSHAEIRSGDVAWIEPGEEHWHGAAADSYLVHMAISLGSHVWLDAVTDDEYAICTQ